MPPLVRSVAKHRYFTGQRAKRSATEYTQYLTYRRGEDREEGGRKFFGTEREDISGREVLDRLQEFKQGRGVMAHELILSPGLNCVDPHEYTRELMDQLERSQGRELEWVAVAHKGEHSHIHVLILGKDDRGRPVRIDRNDHKDLRQWGDRYLEREHTMDRILEYGREKEAREQEKQTRELEMQRLRELQTERPFDKNLQWQIDKGDDLFNKLFANPAARDREPEKEKKPELVREWDKERAIAELDDREKIYRKQEAYSKFTPLDELKRLDHELRSGAVERVEKAEYQQLRQWIQEKEKYGDDYHERKEKGRHVREEKNRARENERYVREFQEVDKRCRETYRDRHDRDDIPMPKGKMQRMFEEAGRFSDDHERYTRAMEEKRLTDLMQRYPERKDFYQQQLEDFRWSYQQHEPGAEKPMSVQQRKLEELGRSSDEHGQYTRNQERQRLSDMMERDPENRERYQKQLDDISQRLREEFAPQLEKPDNVLYLFGWKEKERGEDRLDRKTEDKDHTDDKDRTEDRSDQEQQREQQQQLEQPDHTLDKPLEPDRVKEREEREQREQKEREEREREDRDDRGGR